MFERLQLKRLDWSDSSKAPFRSESTFWQPAHLDKLVKPHSCEQQAEHAQQCEHNADGSQPEFSSGSPWRSNKIFQDFFRYIESNVFQLLHVYLSWQWKLATTQDGNCLFNYLIHKGCKDHQSGLAMLIGNQHKGRWDHHIPELPLLCAVNENITLWLQGAHLILNTCCVFVYLPAFQQYARLSDVTLPKALDMELKGDIEDCLIDIGKKTFIFFAMRSGPYLIS